MAESNLELTHEAGALRITLNRPQVLNALSPELLAELLTVLKTEAAREDVRAVLLTGAGRAFSAGADLAATSIDADVDAILRELYNPVVLALSQLAKPVVAAVNGVAVGAGLGLALACDLRLASEAALFSVGFSAIGLVLDAGTSHSLPRLVGQGRALELAFSNRRLDAAEAERIGLAERVLPAADFPATAWNYVQQLASGPTLAYSLIRQQLQASLQNTLPQQLELEAVLQGRAAASGDAREGIAAFAGKRAASFTGGD
jgi:2-(1,2-epoxy-1,2-dihydrophenyl)acetyl-CoA isomerase